MFILTLPLRLAILWQQTLCDHYPRHLDGSSGTFTRRITAFLATENEVVDFAEVAKTVRATG
jgi:hypothetical protein